MTPRSKGTLLPSLPQVCDGQPDCESVGELGPSPEEQGCGAWGPWSSWGPCSRTCGLGVQARSRHCSPPGLPVLQHCPGPEHQTQACFTAACPGEGPGVPGRASKSKGEEDHWAPSPASCPPKPQSVLPLLLAVDGEWTPWSPWSLCTEPCMGTATRQRQCHPPQNGGRPCAMLPGDPPTTRQSSECKEGEPSWEEGVEGLPVGGLRLQGTHLAQTLVLIFSQGHALMPAVPMPPALGSWCSGPVPPAL